MKKDITSLLLAGFHSYAQENASARFAGAISIPELKHLTVIAGEDVEGRETGTEGQRKQPLISKLILKTGLHISARTVGFSRLIPAPGHAPRIQPDREKHRSLWP